MKPGEVKAMAEGMAAATKDYVERTLAPVVARIETLERDNVALRKDLAAREWKGVWSESTIYDKHNTVTYGGSQWYALVPSKGRKPGQSPEAWKLVVQRGKQGEKGDPA